METGKFYFIKDLYYERFSNCGLMENKEIDSEGNKHGRPCYYCFEINGLYWLIPISSKIDKYKDLYNKKIQKRPNYDGIRFGYVNGIEKAFLIQNLCPVTYEYIDGMYTIENGTKPVTIDEKLAKELNQIVLKIIKLYRKGIRITLSDIGTILTDLEITI